ncbi:nitrite reductase [NAD(P)H] large subunit [Pseudescherichia vulneris]|nr:nitrite reductase [NAD(P)H] large subunit [Pseudescherichia vulneris]
MAVSGCTRECAEAQSKDVGVIATDKGWNLYVCGNGGMKPRHADLLAQDLSTEALIRTVDRFLMFYIRTADRLQRTSTWMDNLEGGMDYLRQVVLEDSLNIAAELESEMQAVVATYQCEWQTTLAAPDRLALFKPFVNHDEPVQAVQGWVEICDLDEIPAKCRYGGPANPPADCAVSPAGSSPEGICPQQPRAEQRCQRAGARTVGRREGRTGRDFPAV